jgi:hypothetical protein
MQEIAQGLVCDGCGQSASPEHVARRLRRLEWATRFRPVHINTVLLSAAAPHGDADFFYSPEGRLDGEARILAEIAGLTQLNRPKGELHAAFQRAGFFATYVLECPYEDNSALPLADLLTKHLPSALARIRRSLRPKRVALISPQLDALVAELSAQLPGCKLVTNTGKAFRLDREGDGADRALLRRLLTADTP